MHAYLCMSQIWLIIYFRCYLCSYWIKLKPLFNIWLISLIFLVFLSLYFISINFYHTSYPTLLIIFLLPVYPGYFSFQSEAETSRTPLLGPSVSTNVSSRDEESGSEEEGDEDEEVGPVIRLSTRNRRHPFIKLLQGIWPFGESFKELGVLGKIYEIVKVMKVDFILSTIILCWWFYFVVVVVVVVTACRKYHNTGVRASVSATMIDIILIVLKFCIFNSYLTIFPCALDLDIIYSKLKDNNNKQTIILFEIHQYYSPDSYFSHCWWAVCFIFLSWVQVKACSSSEMEYTCNAYNCSCHNCV